MNLQAAEAHAALSQVAICPRCDQLRLMLDDCPNCENARDVPQRLIHHFDCGHVDRAESFLRSENSLKCPKCQKLDLIVGSDFEYVEGALTCGGCDKHEARPTVACACDRHQDLVERVDRAERKLSGLDAGRFDPADLVADRSQ